MHCIWDWVDSRPSCGIWGREKFFGLAENRNTILWPAIRNLKVPTNLPRFENEKTWWDDINGAHLDWEHVHKETEGQRICSLIDVQPPSWQKSWYLAQDMGFRSVQTLLTFVSKTRFYIYKRIWGGGNSPFTKPLEFPHDHLNDITIPENLFLFSRSIHLLHPDIIDATTHVHYYVSQGGEEHHHI
jgi:hypothetical protein